MRAAWTVVGAEKAIDRGVHGLVAIAMGVIAATFGGIVRGCALHCS